MRKNLIVMCALLLTAMSAQAQRQRVGEHSSGMQVKESWGRFS